MRISLKWLADYVDLPSPEEVAQRLTMAGLEVEAIERPAKALHGVVVAQVMEAVPHPNADKLQVTQVAMGGGASLQVVCGAKNFKVGNKVPLATVGTTLPGGLTIKVGQLRGVESHGMLCSSKELALDEGHEGLLLLDPDAKIGQPIAETLGLDDVILTLNVTPNRADALSHLGVAREVATLLGKPFKRPSVKLLPASARAESKVKVSIEDPARCPRYVARVIDGVKVGPSPAWLVQRLKACGVRSINNLVDVTNYVMLETGQPLHAFDLSRIEGGQIVVRAAKAGETLTTLDEKVRTLDPDDLLICDAKKPLVLAGVMGGAHSEVSPTTSHVLLECAGFQPGSVRRASKRHQLHTESSHRFERGTDVTGIDWVIDHAAQLMVELAGGMVLDGRVDAYPAPVAPRAVTLRRAHVRKVLGFELSSSECTRILTSLGCMQVGGDVEVTKYQMPAGRLDLNIEEDLIEELARVHGYEHIPPAIPHGLKELGPERPLATVERRLRQAMAGQGFDEVVNFSFVAKGQLEAFLAVEQAVAVQNPISDELSVMRTTLLPSLVANATRAKRHQAQGVRFYELARSYRANPEGGQGTVPVAHEKLELAGLIWGEREGQRSWSGQATADFFDAKGAVESVLTALNVRGATYEAFESPWYHPRASALVRVGSTVVGTLGELHPRAMKALDAPAGVFLFALDVEALSEHAALVPQATALSKFPTSQRDMALVVPQGMASEAVRSVILEVGRPLVAEAHLFDVYVGPQVGEGKKNLAYALVYASAERTLTDVEVTEAHQRIVNEVTQRLGGLLRS